MTGRPPRCVFRDGQTGCDHRNWRRESAGRWRLGALVRSARRPLRRVTAGSARSARLSGGCGGRGAPAGGGRVSVAPSPEAGQALQPGDHLRHGRGVVGGRGRRDWRSRPRRGSGGRLPGHPVHPVPYPESLAAHAGARGVRKSRPSGHGEGAQAMPGGGEPLGSLSEDRSEPHRRAYRDSLRSAGGLPDCRRRVDGRPACHRPGDDRHPGRGLGSGLLGRGRVSPGGSGLRRSVRDRPAGAAGCRSGADLPPVRPGPAGNRGRRGGGGPSAGGLRTRHSPGCPRASRGRRLRRGQWGRHAGGGARQHPPRDAGRPR